MVEVFKSTPIRRMTTGGNYVNLSADVVLLSDYEALRDELDLLKQEYDLLHIAQGGEYADTWKARAEAAERLAGARVVTDEMVRAFIRRSSTTAGDTEACIRAGLSAALAEPAGEAGPVKHGPGCGSHNDYPCDCQALTAPPDASAIREAEKIDPVELVRQEIQKLSKEKDAAEYVIATMVTNLKTGKVTTDQLLEWFDGEGRAALAGAKP